MTVRPALFIYKEIVAGDLRKLVAESNDSKTGGGARDLRFPARGFRQVLERVFTEDGIGQRGRRIRTANFTYLGPDGFPRTTKLECWPPTRSRPGEDRIARVHASPALGGQIPDTEKGRVFVLFIKYTDGMVRVAYAYEDELRAQGVWADEVRNQILGCVDAAQGNRKTVQGYYDFVSGGRYCHAE